MFLHRLDLENRYEVGDGISSLKVGLFQKDYFDMVHYGQHSLI